MPSTGEEKWGPIPATWGKVCSLRSFIHGSTPAYAAVLARIE